MNESLFAAEAATRQINEELQISVAAGDSVARTRMIEANTRLVALKVQQFLSYFPQYSYLEGDLMGEGLLGLVEAVDVIQRNEAPGVNPTGLIALRIKWHLGTAVEQGQDIHLPRTSRRRGEARGEPVTPCKRVEAMLDALPSTETSLADLKECIETCCWTDTEKEIVRLRELGSTDQEIAGYLGLPMTTVYMLRQGIYARVLAELGISEN
jgi:hypothetical protein